MRLTAYKDAAGVWTIGYGHTFTAGAPNPHRGMVITEEKAEEILLRDLTQYENAVEQLVKVKLNDNQFAALVSFTYNVGIKRLKGSTLLKKLNAGKYDDVPSEMMKWTRVGKNRPSGLVNRRSAEAGLWAKGAFVSSAYIKPNKSNSLIKNSAESLAPVAAVAPSLVGYATGSGPFQWALAAVAIVGVVLWGYFYFKRMRDDRL